MQSIDNSRMNISTWLYALSLPLLALSASLQLRLPPQFPSGTALPPSTAAHLDTLGASYTALLQRDGEFNFHNISSGSYLLDVYCRDHVFAPLRVDVSDAETVQVWQTYRGNEWENKGEKIDSRPVVLKVVKGKDYFEKRAGCMYSADVEEVWGA